VGQRAEHLLERRARPCSSTQLVERARRDQPPVVQDRDAVADALGDVEQVGRVEHGAAAVGCVATPTTLVRLKQGTVRPIDKADAAARTLIYGLEKRP